MNADPVLACADLTFAWGRRRVLDGLNLAIARGEHAALLGPNGSGKSTVLRLVAGLMPLAGGRITWRFADTAALPVGDREVRRRVGVVFQHPSLDLALTARENLALSGQMVGLPSRLAKARAADLIASVGLADRADDHARDLSGGMRRRLDLARALLPEPEVLLLDEPTAGLDAEHFERFWSRLTALRAQRGLTLVTATHRPDEAALADRLVMIADGRVVHDGTPEDTVRALGRDLIVVTASEPEAVAGEINGRLPLAATVVGGEVVCAVPPDESASRLLVRLVELFPAGRLDTVVLRRPTLADAFVKLAGRQLAEAA